MTTGFVSTYGGSALDLDQIFDYSQPGVSGDTGFIAGYDGAGQDLARLFTARSLGADIGYNTGFIALDGRDLREWFAKSGTANLTFRGSLNIAALGARQDGQKYGWEEGVGGAWGWQEGPYNPQYLYDWVQDGTGQRLTFLRFGGTNPYGGSNGCVLRTTIPGVGSYTVNFGWADANQEFQSVDDAPFGLAIGQWADCTITRT